MLHSVSVITVITVLSEITDQSINRTLLCRK